MQNRFGRTAGVSCRLDSGESIQVGAQDVALQNEIGEFAFTNDLDQSGGFQFFHMMRKGGGAYPVRFVKDGAGRRAFAGPDLLEYLVASRLGQGARDARELPVRQSN